MSDPHNRAKAKIEFAWPHCQGHPITHYHCGAKCHDCGWGGCGCLETHCCCPNPNADPNAHENTEQNDQNESDEEQPQSTPTPQKRLKRRAHIRRLQAIRKS